MRRRLGLGGHVLSLALPAACVAGAAKWLAHDQKWDLLGASPLLPSFFAATVFLLGFLLAATLGDYKEAEKLPGEIASHLESITDQTRVVAFRGNAKAAENCVSALLAVHQQLLAWFARSCEVEQVIERINELSVPISQLEDTVAANYLVRLHAEQGALRQKVVRAAAIRDTNFNGRAYALADVVSILLIAGLVFTSPVSGAADVLVVMAAAFFTSALIRLIRDMDDPFQYTVGPDGEFVPGLADVALDPLIATGVRLNDARAAVTKAPAGD